MGSQNKPAICTPWSLCPCMTHWDQRRAHTSSTKVINEGGAQGRDKRLRLSTENNTKNKIAVHVYADEYSFHYPINC